MKRKFTVNTRLLKDVIPNHITTFSAFTELINNSIQAKSKNIWIDIDYASESELSPTLIKKIVIKDDGIGVHNSELEYKTLDIATGNKDGGKGIGRFCAFQIGKKFTIETIGYNQKDKTFSESIIPLSTKEFYEFSKLGEIGIDTTEKTLDGSNFETFYKVTIEDLYTSVETENNKERNKRITQQFLPTNINDAVFERYPLEIFNSKVNFHINGQSLKKEDFIVGESHKKVKTYINDKGKEVKVMFNYFQVKNIEEIRVFLMVKNAGIDTVANSFKYDATWLSPKIGGWYIYVQSDDALTSDNYRNIDLDGLDPELSNFRSFIKDNLNQFFKEKNKEFDNFTNKLKDDIHYPYKERQASSKSKELLFDKLAYLVEDKYHILNNQEKLREIIYPLIDKTIANGELEDILREILKLDKKTVTKFHTLLEKTDLEDVIEFSEKVASKKEDLEFLEKIVYSEISKNVKERKQLHKYLEQMLWIFGEQYNGNTRMLSDKNLENNLLELRNKTLKYKPSKEDDNIVELSEKKIKSITDLFLYSEKIIDADKREVLIVELKAPKVKISQKELNQAMRYAQEIEEKGVFPNNVKYKILLVSSDLNRRTQRELRGRQKQYKGDNPYFYYENEDGNIEISVVRWSDLFENTKRKLNYLSAILETKDVDIEEKAKRDFADIEFTKVKSSLKKVANY
ncbi:MAG: ATP-binding protein [Flavobacteriales bacterium]|nr:ATP-binding protein [Flavobacteriales bacterium]